MRKQKLLLNKSKLLLLAENTKMSKSKLILSKSKLILSKSKLILSKQNGIFTMNFSLGDRPFQFYYGMLCTKLAYSGFGERRSLVGLKSKIERWALQYHHCTSKQ
jgi:hypothetical protein